MKTLYTINNLILVSLGIVLLLTLVENSFAMLFAIGLIPLGIYQGATGIVLFIKDYRNTGLKVYILGLIHTLFWMTLDGFGFGFIGWDTNWLWMIPPIPMAIYFTFLLHTLKTKPQKL